MRVGMLEGELNEGTSCIYSNGLLLSELPLLVVLTRKHISC